MGRRGDRYFSKRAQNNDTNTNPTNVRVEGTSNDRDAHNAEWAGFIVMCDESTKVDCFKYRVLGLSEKKKYIMDFIRKGMSLFLFDVKPRLLYGIYAASSFGAFQLEPDAFGGDYPWQVKFHIEKDCLPLSEDVFKPAIKDNYFTLRKFSPKLTTEQVQKLVKLFSPLPGGPIQHPSINVSADSYDAPCINTASFVETGGAIQDRHTQGYPPRRSTHEADKPDEFSQSASLPRFNREPTRPFNDEVNAENSIHGHNHSPKSRHPLPLLPACEEQLIDGCVQSGPLPKPAHPLDAVMTGKMRGYHAPCANHDFRPPTSTFEANKADVFNQRGPPPCLHHEASNLLNDAGMSKKCTHDYHANKSKHSLLPFTPACEAKLPDGFNQGGPLSRLTHEPMQLLNEAVVSKKCMHGCHAPRATHDFLPPTATCGAGMTDGFIESDLHAKLNRESRNLLNDALTAEKCMYGYGAFAAKYEQICVAHDPPLLPKHCKAECKRHMYLSHVNGLSILPTHNHPSRVNFQYPGYPQGRICGNSAAHLNSSVYKHSHPMPATIQGNLLDRKLHEGELLVDSSICHHAEIASESPLNAGVFNALPGHYCKAVTHKRRFQEICACALRDAPISVPNTSGDISGESTCKCMYHQILRRPFGRGALDDDVLNGYSPCLY